MSFAPLMYTCDTSGYARGDIVAMGGFFYDSPSGLVPIHSERGSCYQCKDLAPIEALPSAKTTKDLESRIEKSISDWLRLREKPEKSDPS